MSGTILRVGGERRLMRGMRRLLVIAGVLVFLAGIQLFVFPERTSRFFAWTIDVPLTAAFLGAGYWASVILEWLAARERLWARARIAVPAVLVFTTLTLVATLIHLDLFHLDRSIALGTRAVTWLWIAIYALVPPAMLVLAVVQWRAPGTDAPRARALPLWVRAVLATHAVVMVGLGAALFIAPEDAGSVWPWALTPLTGRAVGAWLLGIGVAAAQAVWENDLARVRVALLSYIALASLQLVALARYLDAVSFSEAATWLYVAFLLSMLGVGCYGVGSHGAAAARTSA
jgi:hypothetical protein